MTEFRAAMETSPCAGPDGTHFVTIEETGSARLWDLKGFQRIGPALELRGRIVSARFQADGRSLTLLDDHGNLADIPVRRAPDEPMDRLWTRLKTQTGYESSANGREAVPLGGPEWNRLRSTEREPGEEDPEETLRRHETSARDAEALGDGFGARTHLDRLIVARADDALLYARRARARLWSNEVAAADADLETALRLGPRDRILDWLLHRSIDFLYERRPDDALRLLDRAAAERPDDWLTYALRAEVHAASGDSAASEADVVRALDREPEAQYLLRIADERAFAGRWSEAAALYERAIEHGPVPYDVWMEAAVAHLVLRDRAAYGRVVRRMIERHPAEIHEPLIALTLADVATIGPVDAVDAAKALRWVQGLPALFAKRPGLKRSALDTVGSLLHRLGREAEAIAALEGAKAIADGPISPEERIFLAMARHAAGDRSGGLESSSANWDAEMQGPSREVWWGRRVRELLSREAARQVLDPLMPANPFGVRK